MVVSVITINYNNVLGLTRTIDSVLLQKYKDFEFIVIDGGSDDGSVDVIKNNQKDISYWVSEHDRGIYHAMNKGVLAAHGDYCIFMNSGDVFCDENVLLNMQKYLGNVDIVIGRLLNSTTGDIIFPPPQREISLYYLYTGTVTHQSSFIKTDLLRKSPYDEEMRIAADWKFFLMSIIYQDCSVEFVPQMVAYFDMNGLSTSNPIDAWNEKIVLLDKLLPRRVLLDYIYMKQSECLTQSLTSELRIHYKIDKLLFHIGSILLRILNWRYNKVM